MEQKSKKKPRILIVDDAPENLRAIASFLSKEYALTVVTNGEDALRAAESSRPDLILLDIVMPDMDGYEVCRRLKAHDQTADIPVIFITSKGDAQDEFAGLEMGAIDYITKPFHTAIVKMRVRNHLELKLIRDTLRGLSSLDGLTGIPNRRNFDAFLEKSWQGGLRSGGVVSLILMDIDCFKPYNDHYGHAAGDECLKRIAAAIASAVQRPSDLVARYGGEEFVCVLPATDFEGMKHTGEKVCAAVSDLRIPHVRSVVTDHVTLSLGGVTMLPTPGSAAGALVEAADINLYRAKEEGRNRLICSSALPQHARERVGADPEA